MVQKITIFEPHIDIDQLGPKNLPMTSAEESTEPETSESSMAGKLAVLIGGAVTLGLLGAVLYRRRNGHRIEIEEITEETPKAEA